MTGVRVTRAVSLATALTIGVWGLGVLGTSAATGAETAAPTQQRAAVPPNIVIVLSDDQPKGTMAAMPGVRSRIRDEGITFSNAIIPSSICCPARTSLLSGNFSHTTGVYSNNPEYYGGWPAFEDDENRTLATELSDAGYRTGLFGKYLNGYSKYGWQVSGPRSMPPGWDEFVVMDPLDDADADYYSYSLYGTQFAGPFGRTAADYSTDVIRNYAVDFVQTTPDDKPLFMMVNVFGPHGPFTPAPRHEGTWADRPVTLPGGVNEEDMSDKPSWMQDLQPFKKRVLERQTRRRMETLRSVDEALVDVVKALGDRAENTLFVYTSDNGIMQGIHRLQGKDMPYRASHEVPLYMRWDGVIEPGTVTDRITPGVDVTATLAEAAGVSWAMEGRSALSTTRTGVVLESVGNERRPAYCGWRTDRYLYVRYSGGDEIELYDYRVDPDELDNVAGKRKYTKIQAKLDRRAQNNCQPVPPDFSWDQPAP